jgi:N-acetylmuramoyl-L-alanine amidase
MATKRVYIGVGHGGSDPGAVFGKFKEKDLALEIAKYCDAYLKKYGVETKMSRRNDSAVWLEQRIAQANAWGADLAVDVHINAGKGDGAEVYHTLYGGTGKKLATNTLKEMEKIGQNSRGTKVKKNAKGNDYFGFVRDILCPSVLCECAFIDSKDVEIIDTKAERKKMGEAIAKGILKTLGIKITKPKVYGGEMPKLSAKGYLEYGDSGEEVKKWQKYLVWYGYKIDVDGSFGINTERATIDFQTKMGFATKWIDGLVGAKTIKQAKKIKK